MHQNSAEVFPESFQKYSPMRSWIEEYLHFLTSIWVQQAKCRNSMPYNSEDSNAHTAACKVAKTYFPLRLFQALDMARYLIASMPSTQLNLRSLPLGRPQCRPEINFSHARLALLDPPHPVHLIPSPISQQLPPILISSIPNDKLQHGR